MTNILKIKWSLHPLFILILLASVVTGYFLELITLFILVLVHELGHIVMALSIGWKVKAVKLLPFGGVVEVDESAGSSARDELLVALAGPLQNIWMACLAWIMGEFGLWSMEWSQYLIQANLWLAVFNLLPILPLDGGKILLAMLSYRLRYFECLLWCARLSIISSIALIFYACIPALYSINGVRLNELMIGAFLLYSNLIYYRHIPFIFYRFLLVRSKRVEQLEGKGAKVVPILVQSKQTMYNMLKRLKREQLHLMCIVDQATEGVNLLSEQQFLQHCTSVSNLHRAVGDIFR